MSALRKSEGGILTSHPVPCLRHRNSLERAQSPNSSKPTLELYAERDLPLLEANTSDSQSTGFESNLSMVEIIVIEAICLAPLLELVVDELVELPETRHVDVLLWV